MWHSVHKGCHLHLVLGFHRLMLLVDLDSQQELWHPDMKVLEICKKKGTIIVMTLDSQTNILNVLYDDNDDNVWRSDNDDCFFKLIISHVHNLVAENSLAWHWI